MKPITRSTIFEATAQNQQQQQNPLSEVENHNETTSRCSSNPVDRYINVPAVIEDHQKSSSWMPSESGAEVSHTSLTLVIGEKKEELQVRSRSPLQQETHLNMDAILSDPSQPSPPVLDTATEADHGNRLVTGHHSNSPSSSKHICSFN